jgi:hypothetical protein
MHVSLNDFMFKQLPSVRATGANDDLTRQAWAITSFATFFFGTLQRIYVPEIGKLIETLFRPKSTSFPYAPYRPRPGS